MHEFYSVMTNIFVQNIFQNFKEGEKVYFISILFDLLQTLRMDV